MGAVSCVGGLTCVGALGMRTGIVIAATGQKQSGRNRNQEGRFHVGNLTQTAKNPSRTWAGRFGCSAGLVARSFRPSAFAAPKHRYGATAAGRTLSHFRRQLARLLDQIEIVKIGRA